MYLYVNRMYSYVTRILLVCTRMLLVCIRMLLLCTRILLECTRILLVCTRILLVSYSYFTHAYPYLTPMYPCVSRMYWYVTRMNLCGVLFMIGHFTRSLPAGSLCSSPLACVSKVSLLAGYGTVMCWLLRWLAFLFPATTCIFDNCMGIISVVDDLSPCEALAVLILLATAENFSFLMD